MNYVEVPESKIFTTTKLANICASGETAFIGRCGSGPSHNLYLISRDGIALAADPTQEWNDDGWLVEIEQFVDLEILVRLKPKEKPLKRL